MQITVNETLPTEGPVISVVIPSYNRRDSVLALLSDVYAQQGVSFEVIVVDDCSPDGSADAIAAAFPQVTLLRNEKNGGPCVARNRGIRAARGEFIVGLDSDVRLPDRSLLGCVEVAFERHLRATGFAFRILEADGVTEDDERWWHPLPIDSYAASAFETSYFSGTAFAFRREAMMHAGLFPEVLYMHYEEVVLAFRVIDAGGKIGYLPNLAVIHCANPTERRSRIRVFYKPRNQILLTLLCYPLLQGLHFLVPRLGFAFIQAIHRGHLGDFLDALRSAWSLSSRCKNERQVLKVSTLRRIAVLKDANQNRWNTMEESPKKSMDIQTWPGNRLGRKELPLPPRRD